ncbi:hypothetical protein MSAN_01392900 [Mycena sanguinolenta]|uniref:MYND-type domain-containing protein n=1 Tax=Mycena sanguinolenta TaxID=230812 RepID=A0A8H6YAB6_9AGAR|nr:hypothetical protein MSAN_01392900 [Mycena sanguinolenta]
MPSSFSAPKFRVDDRAGSDFAVATVWDRWQPACDTCGRLESSLKRKSKLLTCSGCLLAKYCSKECQKQDWSNEHKNRCHLFEADRKLSTVFAKSLGPGTINDPTLSLVDKCIQWNFLNVYNHMVIAGAALKNDENLAKSQTVDVGIFLKLVGERTNSKYDHRTFIIDKVGLLPRQDTAKYAEKTKWIKGNLHLIPPIDDHIKVLVGYCRLPEVRLSETQMWKLPVSSIATHILPPGFDLHRYIAHVNRGITHFHASFWPLPRNALTNLTEAELQEVGNKPPEGWVGYGWRHHELVSGLKGQGVVGIQRPDGTKVPIFKYSRSGHIRFCAPGETDTEGPEEFKKLMVDPSKMVRMIYNWLEYFTFYQGSLLEFVEDNRRKKAGLPPLLRK